MKTIKKIKKFCINIASPLLLFFMMCISSNSYAILDSTIFRIKVVQDSVYAGDTVDVDFFIGDANILSILNILNEFEIEIATDTSLIKKDQITFKLDTASLTTFFGTTISNITSIINIDPVLGKLNVKTNSNSTSKGNSRIGSGKYIVQDNAAGRQYMRFDYTKANSKGLLGLINPVRTIIDSVLIINKPSIPTAIIDKRNNKLKVYPNPALDFIQIEGGKISQYQLVSVNGSIILSVMNTTEFIQLNLSEYSTGLYILKVLSDNNWNYYKIIKN